MKFRPLTAGDVECRVASCTEKGASLLLYKNARVDMAILDETVGPMNWQRHHQRDNANCIIAIWDDEKKQWIEKEDTGTESNTEAQKGLASDSFKRAGFNWGIGRELYTSPFIWISADKAKIYDTGRKNQYGKPVFATKAHFFVSDMTVTDGRITGLSISDGKEIVYRYGSVCRENEKTNEANSAAEKLTARAMCQRVVKAYCQSHNASEKGAWDIIAQSIGKASKDFTKEDWDAAKAIAEGWNERTA